MLTQYTPSDYDDVTALVQMTLCTTPRARAVLDMTGGDVNAAADIINRQNKVRGAWNLFYI